MWKQILRKSGQWFVCSSQGHISKDCRSSWRCSRCEGKHHSSICSKKRGKQLSGQLTKHNTYAEFKSQPWNHFIHYQEFPFNLTVCKFQQDSVVADCMLRPQLWVTLEEVVCEDDTRPRSQRSYITERVKRVLSLRSSRQQCISILISGSEQGLCEVVRVRVRTQEGPDEELKLIAVQPVCEPLALQPIKFCVLEAAGPGRHIRWCNSNGDLCLNWLGSLLEPGHWWNSKRHVWTSFH